MVILKKYVYKIQNILNLKKQEHKNKKWTSRLNKFIRENKIISISIVMFLFCVIMNLILINFFIKTLQQIITI